MPMTKILVATALALAAGGCKKTIDKDKAEKTIGDQLRAHGMNPTVTCPEGRKVKAGDVFTCTVVEPEAGTVTITVTQKDDEGNVEWSSDGQLIATADVIAEVKKQVPDAVVECDKHFVLIKDGASYPCKITSGGKTGTLQIKNIKGELSWETQ
jgi:hypothetical protein